MKMKISFFISSFIILSFLISYISSYCSNHCSNHGTCVQNHCVCNENWGGSECSIFDQAITLGQTVSSSVDDRRWKYYHFYLSFPTQIKIWLNITNIFSRECELYVQKNSRPYFTNYFARNRSHARYIYISIPDASAGTWNIGVYGETDCNFNLEALILSCSSTCLNGGRCDQGKCLCTNTYKGIDCSEFIPPIENDQSYNGDLILYEYDYYYLNISKYMSNIQIRVQDHQLGDVDVYASYNSKPTRHQYNYGNTTSSDITIIKITNPHQGLLWIGLYGYNPYQRYTLIVTWDTADIPDCISGCSQHGTCSYGVCSCKSDYFGSSCEYYNQPMIVGIDYAGFITTNNWNYYILQSSTQNTIIINLESFVDENCDLFIKAGNQYPTQSSYDFINISNTNKEQIQIVSPGINNYRIGILAKTSSCNYLVYLDQKDLCSCGQNAHGNCQSGSTICHCDSGWAGHHCDIEVKPLAQVNNLELKIKTSEWQYYSIKAQGSTISIVAKELLTQGMIELFIKAANFPTKLDFDTKNQTLTEFHTLELEFNQPSNQLYYIGIFGSSAIVGDREIKFKISGFASIL
eukprot:TRINITY_DN8100_c0_g1_i1.p1 TRINITY_DN8100_c0_g1~~TRINITY_DN8100_c0_g1_i1.p1  ORF type:complete len:577 (+),score=158.43 TRINITY_DN8100_c0_g1_i1:103-1833(+)